MILELSYEYVCDQNVLLTVISMGVGEVQGRCQHIKDTPQELKM